MRRVRVREERKSDGEQMCGWIPKKWVIREVGEDRENYTANMTVRSRLEHFHTVEQSKLELPVNVEFKERSGVAEEHKPKLITETMWHSHSLIDRRSAESRFTTIDIRTNVSLRRVFLMSIVVLHNYPANVNFWTKLFLLAGTVGADVLELLQYGMLV